MWIASQVLSLGHSNHEEKRETALDSTTTGAKCVDLMESIYTDIVKGNMAAAFEAAGELRKYAVEQVEQSEQIVTKIKKVMEEHKQKIEEIQRNVARLHEQENALRLRMSHKEASLKVAKNELSRAQTELSDANTKLQYAHAEVTWEREKSTVLQGLTTAAGIILGAFTPIPFIGSLFGGYTGNRIGAVISEDYVGAAEYAVEKWKQKVNQYQADQNSLKIDISEIEKDISVIKDQIKHQEEERFETNKSAKQMKGAAVFFHKAFVFWKKVHQASEHGGNRAELLQRIIGKAKEKENLDFLKCDGCKKVAMTFVEAWDVMVTHFMTGREFISGPYTLNTLSRDEL